MKWETRLTGLLQEGSQGGSQGSAVPPEPCWEDFHRF